MEATAWGQC